LDFDDFGFILKRKYRRI